MAVSSGAVKSPRLWLALALAAALAMAGMLFAAAKPGAVQAQVPATYVCSFEGAAGPLTPPVQTVLGNGDYLFDTDPTGNLDCTYNGVLQSDGRIQSNGSYENVVCGTGIAWSHPRDEDLLTDPAHDTEGTANNPNVPSVTRVSYTILFVGGVGQLTVHHWENEVGESGSGAGEVRITAQPSAEQCLEEDGVAEFSVEGRFTLVQDPEIPEIDD
jgi:hypothetical protein